MTEYQELGTPDNGVDGVEQNSTPTTPAQEENRQPKEPKGDDKPSVNLDDLPEYRAVKSKYDSTISKTQNELKAEREQREQLQQRTAWMEQQLEQLQTRDMDEPTRANFEIQKRDRQIQAMQNMLDQQRMSTVKNQALMNIQQRAKGLGVDVQYEELLNYEGADDAWEHILGKALQTSAVRQQQRQQKQEANAVDLGGGQTVSSGSELQEKYNKAVKSFDANAMLKILDQAARDGVELSL